MKKLLLLALLGGVLLSATQVLADDGFYVIPTRATPGTAITYLPYTITAPGYYYLTGNLASSGGNGITVNADNVTIDLMGFTLTATFRDSGILIIDSRNNVEVRNGTVKGWWCGVLMDPDNLGTGSGHRIIGIRAVGNATGVFLGGTGTGHLIKGCTALPTSSAGTGLQITGKGTIQGCTVMNFSLRGIYIGDGGTISDNVVQNCTGVVAFGIQTRGNTTISHNAVINCNTGISSEGGGSIIGNAVKANAGQTGIAPATNTDPSDTPSLLDQNSVNGDDSAHYGPGNKATVWGLNGG